MRDELQKRIIVTGGAKGIGRGVALNFAQRGASVVIADVDDNAGEKCVQDIAKQGGKGLFVHTDVSSEKDVENLFKKAHDFQDGIDVLVNNAGIAHGPFSEQHFLKTDFSMWQNLMKVNLNGLYLCSQMAAKMMIREGNEGVIVNMSSGGATRAHRNRVAYDATKGAIEAATRAMALDLAPWKIRVNAVMPGAFEVESRTAVGDASSPADLIPLGRLGIPEDVAQAVRFITSSDASYITGHVLVVDGGLTAQLRPPVMDAKIELSDDEVNE